MLIDRPYRSVLKAISWRTTGTLDTIVISFLLTGRLEIALSIGLVEVVTKTVLYYLHERAWNRLNLGRVEVKPPEYTI